MTTKHIDLKMNIAEFIDIEQQFVMDETLTWQRRIDRRQLSVTQAKNKLFELIDFLRANNQLSERLTFEQIAEVKNVFVASPKGVFQSEIDVFENNGLSERLIKTWKFDTPTFGDLRDGFLRRFPDVLDIVYSRAQIREMESMVYKSTNLMEFIKIINELGRTQDFRFKLNTELGG